MDRGSSARYARISTLNASRAAKRNLEQRCQSGRSEDRSTARVLVPFAATTTGMLTCPNSGALEGFIRESNMFASTNAVRTFLFSASLGMALVGFASMASALPVYSALTLVKATPRALQDVQWRGHPAGWRRGWGSRPRWGGGHRLYPIERYYIAPTYLYPCRSLGRSWPDRLGCW